MYDARETVTQVSPKMSLKMSPKGVLAREKWNAVRTKSECFQKALH